MCKYGYMCASLILFRYQNLVCECTVLHLNWARNLTLKSSSAATFMKCLYACKSRQHFQDRTRHLWSGYFCQWCRTGLANTTKQKEGCTRQKQSMHMFEGVACRSEALTGASPATLNPPSELHVCHLPS
eukprot:1147943-Pelagomonas_calceolata.AAC.7